jgi:GT2 family glycosyltransferase
MTSRQPSLIILTYNRFSETTGRCLASLAEDPDFARWDMIIVDNGSDEASRANLAETQTRYPTLKVLYLERNLGFPAGMNAGLRVATGDPIFLVNSDVLVPPGTIARLTSALQKHSNAGLVAPVTNAAGNEQKIFVDSGQPAADMLRRGLDFANAGNSAGVFAYRLDFCFVGLRRAVYETVGGLDEIYSPGYYEDFDYSLMARKAGFDLLVAEDAFIYHEGGASFGRISKEKKALLARNKQRFLDKHGRDTTLPHIRDGNIAILRQYLTLAEAGSPPPMLRIVTRQKLAEKLLPRGPLKRWRYLRKVKALRKQLNQVFKLPGPEA